MKDLDRCIAEGKYGIGAKRDENTAQY